MGSGGHCPGGVRAAYGQNDALAPAPCIFLHVVFDGHDEPVQANLRFLLWKMRFREDDLRVQSQLSEIFGNAGGQSSQPAPSEGAF